ncbi:Protein phosphatase 2C (PP2C)-like domain [Pseudocohnilembus persalinus]|uniref:protein-serine/threonine phosphatase n=1 Tax=Pseudocohnilembus persalinus TaxID=266149 RepID=A0A0V0QDR7_PSEPJ|nr:Protein phosphatase 2C (PP2C)-like domain [Pseudocohnilembus persalinus]|eukprot:KRX00345.1 Protein phosphatase 2C (PP2C)-like domain [Pseudocohnilembus persalinus]
MGPYQSTPTTQKNHSPATGVHKSSILNAVASDMQGWRNGMEDAHICATDIGGEDISIFGVFDGHGGKEVAKFVELHFVEEIVKLQEYKDKNFEEALIKVFQQMDEMMEKPEGQIELAKIRLGTNEEPLGGQSYAGCTANVALFYKNTLYIANAGDSRSVICKNGKAVALSEDHKPEDTKEKTRIREAGGFVTEGRVNGNLNLSRALGDLEYKNNKDLKPCQQLIISKPDVTKTELNKDFEFLLMGCDGIWECKSNQELIEFCKERIEKKMDIQTINSELLDEILAPDTSNGTGCDNMSVILITFTQNWYNE